MKKSFTIFFIASFIGIGFGYWWAWSALNKTHQKEIARYELILEQKKIIIDHYQKFWTPIRTTLVRKRIK